MPYLAKLTLEPRYNPTFGLDSGDPGDLKVGRPSNPILPIRAVEASKFKTIPDFVSVNGIWTVCEEFKEMVEKLEPELHEFIPIELIRKSGAPTEKRCCLSNIRQVIDSIVPERSDVEW